MTTLSQIVLFVIAEHVLLGIGFIIYHFVQRSWNIPVVIFRYTGDKRRPSLRFTKAKLKVVQKIPKLFIKGYEYSFKNFKSNNYYPAAKSPLGALVLWEFKPGWLTPTLPSVDSLPEDMREEAERLFSELRERTTVDFEYDDSAYERLVLKAVDDVDAEWHVTQIARINDQYVSGWRDFMNKYGGHVIVFFIALCLLVGWIVWLKESPDWVNKCISTGVEAAKNTYLQTIAENVASTGVPPG